MKVRVAEDVRGHQSDAESVSNRIPNTIHLFGSQSSETPLEFDCRNGLDLLQMKRRVLGTPWGYSTPSGCREALSCAAQLSQDRVRLLRVRPSEAQRDAPWPPSRINHPNFTRIDAAHLRPPSGQGSARRRAQPGCTRPCRSLDWRFPASLRE